jgi:hypothetical protein
VRRMLWKNFCALTVTLGCEPAPKQLSLGLNLNHAGAKARPKTRSSRRVIFTTLDVPSAVATKVADGRAALSLRRSRTMSYLS